MLLCRSCLKLNAIEHKQALRMFSSPTSSLSNAVWSTSKMSKAVAYFTFPQSICGEFLSAPIGIANGIVQEWSDEIFAHFVRILQVSAELKAIASPVVRRHLSWTYLFSSTALRILLNRKEHFKLHISRPMNLKASSNFVRRNWLIASEHRQNRWHVHLRDENHIKGSH